MTRFFSGKRPDFLKGKDALRGRLARLCETGPYGIFGQFSVFLDFLVVHNLKITSWKVCLKKLASSPKYGCFVGPTQHVYHICVKTEAVFFYSA